MLQPFLEIILKYFPSKSLGIFSGGGGGVESGSEEHDAAGSEKLKSS